MSREEVKSNLLKLTQKNNSLLKEKISKFAGVYIMQVNHIDPPPRKIYFAPTMGGGVFSLVIFFRFQSVSFDIFQIFFFDLNYELAKAESVLKFLTYFIVYSLLNQLRSQTVSTRYLTFPLTFLSTYP